MWLIKILLLSVFLVFLVENNTELVSFWPFSKEDFMVGVSVMYLGFFILGYLYGRLAAWGAYAPVRARLKQQKKENKILSKEHEKLNVENEKLNMQVTSLQEEQEKNGKDKFSLNRKIKDWFSKSNVENRE